MARSRPAKGQTSDGSGGIARRSPPRAVSQRPKADKPGSVTKGQQRGRRGRFVADVITEMRKVSWPDRRTLAQATGVVIVFVAIVTAYLASVDAIFRRLVGVLF